MYTQVEIQMGTPHDTFVLAVMARYKFICNFRGVGKPEFFAWTVDDVNRILPYFHEGFTKSIHYGIYRFTLKEKAL